MHYNISRVLGFPGGSEGKMSACNPDPSSIPGLGRSPGEGNGNPLWYACLGNPLDRGAWCAAVDGVTKESDSTERMMGEYTYIHTIQKCI